MIVQIKIWEIVCLLDDVQDYNKAQASYVEANLDGVTRVADAHLEPATLRPA